jgi:hypothetical protein
MLGGKGGVRGEPKKAPKRSKQVALNYKYNALSIWLWSYEINPAKSLNGASSRLLNGRLQKISTFLDLFGPKMARAPPKKSWPLEKSQFSARDH